MLGGWRWPWPPEFKIFDMGTEIKANKLVLEQRLTMAKETVFNFWKPFKPVQATLRALDPIAKFEGYLTVLEIRKPD